MVGNQRQQTKVCNGGGKNPQWSDTFQFNNQDQMLRVQVYDDDFGKDELLGEGTVNLMQCYQNPNRT